MDQAQRQWLERIGKQLKVETIVDHDALEGFDRINMVFEGKLDKVLGDLHEELWRDVG